YRDGRQADHVALCLGLPAARHQGQCLIAAGALSSRRPEAAQHEKDLVRIQDVKHRAQSPDSHMGCTRSLLKNLSESCSNPPKKFSQGSLVTTRTPPLVRLR